jgi:hypothetical protein
MRYKFVAQRYIKKVYHYKLNTNFCIYTCNNQYCEVKGINKKLAAENRETLGYPGNGSHRGKIADEVV